MKLRVLSMLLVGAFANFSFDVLIHRAITIVVNEWQCSNCKWHSYEGTTKCYWGMTINGTKY